MIMFGLKRKLTLAFGGMLLILAIVGSLSALLLTRYSSTIERLFRENYDSVIYAQTMKDAVDQLDDLVQRSLWSGSGDVPAEERVRQIERFEDSLRLEQGNITVAGERELSVQVDAAWQAYKTQLGRLQGDQRADFDRRAFYQSTLLGGAQEVKRLAQHVIDINLASIVAADGQVRESAIFARNAMAGLVATGFVLGVLLTGLIGRAILKPLRTLTTSVEEVARGNLDLSVNVASRDELGQLADAFNSMAARLREYRRSDRAKLMRVQKTTLLALNSFPDAVAIVGLDGKIELANEIAQRQFGLVEGADLAKATAKELWAIFESVYSSLRPIQPKAYDTAIQAFVDGNERFFLPQAVPILAEDRQLIGVTLVLADVTELRRLDEMKSGLIAVVSHELKTPLTSIRMSTHLLLEERLGPLTAKQADLLVTARDDAERLNAIIERLLDIGRIESGRALMDLRPVPVEQLVLDATERLVPSFRGRGIALTTTVAPDLPDVLVDTNRIDHVFSNLLDNALKYTRSGGNVTVTAQSDGDYVAFTVSDTGLGIPEDALPRVFERFYRVPGQDDAVKGAGLGLAIAREIVEAHGGSIAATSQVGEGSAFTFTLKAADTQPTG